MPKTYASLEDALAAGPRAKSLALQGAGAVLDDRIAALTQLRELRLLNVSLDSLPAAVCTLPELRDLYLVRTCGVPHEIGQLAKLRTLSVSSPDVTTLPESIGDCKKLRTLSLVGCPIESLPDSMSKLRALQWLELDGHALSALPTFLGALPKLSSKSIDVAPKMLDDSGDASPFVRFQVERLGGTMKRQAAREVETAAGTRTMPAGLATFLGAKWPGDKTLHIKLNGVPAEVTLAQVEGDAFARDTHPLIAIGHDDLSFNYVVSLDDPNPFEPLVYRVDHGAADRLPSERYGTPLNRWLASLRAKKAKKPSAKKANAKSDRGHAALLDAILNNRIDDVRSELSQGAPVTAFDKNGLTPLFVAIARFEVDLVRALLDAGADPNATLKARKDSDFDRFPFGQYQTSDSWLAGETPLYLAASGHLRYQPKRRRRLDDETAAALMARRIEIAKRLVEAGADPNAQTEHGRTPLGGAAGQGGMCDWPEVADLVRALVDMGCRLSEREAAHVMTGMVVTRPKAFELLLGAGGDARLVAHKGRTPLHYAAHAGAAETVALLIAAGADVDAEEAGGTRPLHYAAGRHTEVVRALLDAGADAKAQRTGPCPFANLGPDEARTPLEVAKHREAPPELIALLEAAG